MSRIPFHQGKDLSSIPSRTVAEVLLAAEFLETLPDAIVVVDSDGRILQINSRTPELFGYSRKELIGQKIEVLVPERLRGEHHHHRDHYVEDPKVRRMGAGLELYGRRRNGTEFPVEISLSPVSVLDGTIVLSAIRDISERKRMELELRRAHEELERRSREQIGEYRSRLAAIIDSSEDAIIGKNLEGIITSWNKGAERIYGYTPEEVVGKNIGLLAPSDRADEIPEILRKIARGESTEHYESIRVTKDGRHVNVSITVSPLRDAAGDIVGASAIARDITAQRRAEGQLRQAQKMEAVGRLAGGVAHDFNNILAIVNSCTEFLRDRIDRTSEPAIYIENIRKATERGISLTRQLLAFGRKKVIQPVVLDLNERLRETSKLLRPLMGDDVEVVLRDRSGPALVEADPGQIDQVVMNLAVNARDAMPRGGRFILETARVDFDAAFAGQNQPLAPGQYVMLAVSDEGSGMDKATQSRIFEPFFTTKEPGKGTGLGLATVYGVVQQSGGHIWVYSEPGHGTTFKIYLPSAEHRLGMAPERVEESAPIQRAATILLVEDDEIMRSLTARLLREHGYKVIEAGSGKLAMDLAKPSAGKIDVLLTDVMMPGMSGVELAERMTADRGDIKAIFMSGYTGELMTDHRGLESGALLEKPFTRTALLEALQKALQ